MGQETDRTALQRLLQAAYCLIGFPALGGQQSQSFVGQRTGGREFLGQCKIRLGIIQAVDPEKFVAQAKPGFHRSDDPRVHGYG